VSVNKTRIGGPHTTLALIWGLGVGELMIILVILTMLFGAKRIPELARGIGSGIRSFKSALKEDDPQDPDRTLPPEPRPRDSLPGDRGGQGG
jgi:sec-independent protein translocase protein TatA